MSSFQYRADYRFAMSDAHRRPAHHLGMPAITRHMAFWQPQGISDGQWIAEIERLMLDIFDRACDMTADIQRAGSKDEIPRPTISNLQGHPKETTGPHELLRNCYQKTYGSPNWHRVSREPVVDIPTQSRYETVQVDFLWNSLPVTIRAEVFEEYFTLTAFISFWKNSKHTRRSDYLFRASDDNFNKAFKALNEISDGISSRCEDERRNRDVRQERRDTIERLRGARSSDVLFVDLWRHLERSINDGALFPDLGAVFADFRGVILQCELGDPRMAVREPPKVVSRPCTAVQQSHTLAATGVPLGNDEEVLNWVEALLPVLLSLESDITLRNNPADTIEYTFSTAGYGRCVFGTGFGHQAPHQEHPTVGNIEDRKGKPISFIVLSSHDDHREIGRLINRLHTMGTLRLASLQSLAQVIEAESEIGTLRQRLIEASRRLSDLSKATATGEDGDDGAEGVARIAEEKLINDELGAVRDGLSAVDKIVDGGIANRTLRAGYYLDRFNALVQAMSFKRIAGYQPYDQFVRHRLDRAFGKIAEVGARRREVADMERTIRGQYLHYRSENHQFAIRKIQYYAELAFLLIVLPHYGSELSIAALGLEHHDIPLTIAGITPFIVTARFVVLIWISGCTLWSIRRYRHDIAFSSRRLLQSFKSRVRRVK